VRIYRRFLSREDARRGSRLAAIAAIIVITRFLELLPGELMNLALCGVTLLLSLTISACGSSKGSNPGEPSTPITPVAPTPTGPTLQSVILQPTGVPPRFYASGATNQTVAVGTFSDGTRDAITTSCTDWQSDNTFVLTINNQGLLTAHNSGSATITTTCQGVFARGLVPLNVIPTTLWTRSGVGSTSVVEVPLYVGRLRITGRSNGRVLTNFAALADGFLLFQVSLPPNVPYDGTHIVRARSVSSTFISVQVADSQNTTAWTLTEVR
jgi:Bacterial Ig-like domain (group 2)